MPNVMQQLFVMNIESLLREYAASQKYPYVDYHSVLKDEGNGLPLKHAADGVHPPPRPR